MEIHIGIIQEKEDKSHYPPWKMKNSISTMRISSSNQSITRSQARDLVDQQTNIFFLEVVLADNLKQFQQ